MITKVTSEDFKGLVNPYTGEPMEVKMSVTPSGVLFFCPDTYSTAERFDDPNLCYRRWNRVNGVEGGRSDRPIKCAYTGEPLTLTETAFGFCYSGGFDPRMFRSREEFLYYATMRDGVSKYAKPSAAVRVEAPLRTGTVTERMRKHADGERTELTDEAVKFVEDAAKGPAPAKTTVSISRKRNGR